MTFVIKIHKRLHDQWYTLKNMKIPTGIANNVKVTLGHKSKKDEISMVNIPKVGPKNVSMVVTIKTLVDLPH